MDQKTKHIRVYICIPLRCLWIIYGADLCNTSYSNTTHCPCCHAVTCLLYKIGANRARDELADISHGSGRNRQDRLRLVLVGHDRFHQAAVRKRYARYGLRRDSGVSTNCLLKQTMLVYTHSHTLILIVKWHFVGWHFVRWNFVRWYFVTWQFVWRHFLSDGILSDGILSDMTFCLTWHFFVRLHCLADDFLSGKMEQARRMSVSGKVERFNRSIVF